jgi:hypothetical protein
LFNRSRYKLSEISLLIKVYDGRKIGLTKGFAYRKKP